MKPPRGPIGAGIGTIGREIALAWTCVLWTSCGTTASTAETLAAADGGEVADSDGGVRAVTVDAIAGLCLPDTAANACVLANLTFLPNSASPMCSKAGCEVPVGCPSTIPTAEEPAASFSPVLLACPGIASDDWVTECNAARSGLKIELGQPVPVDQPATPTVTFEPLGDGDWLTAREVNGYMYLPFRVRVARSVEAPPLPTVLRATANLFWCCNQWAFALYSPAIYSEPHDGNSLQLVYWQQHQNVELSASKKQLANQGVCGTPLVLVVSVTEDTGKRGGSVSKAIRLYAPGL